MEKKTVLENLDLVLLAMDETVDGGCGPVHCEALNVPASSTMRTALAAMPGWKSGSPLQPRSATWHRCSIWSIGFFRHTNWLSDE